jgi:hypothetical protein
VGIRTYKSKVSYGTQYDMYDRLIKRLVCNTKGSICKDPTVENNSIRLIF